MNDERARHWMKELAAETPVSLPPADRVFLFGESTDAPLTGDWDGNGATEIGVHRGNVFYQDFNGNGRWDGVAGGDRQFAIGNETDTPLTGDWDGDGDSEIGFHRGDLFYQDLNGNGVWDGVGGGDRVFHFGCRRETRPPG